MAFLWVERLVLSCLGALGVELYLILRLERRGAVFESESESESESARGLCCCQRLDRRLHARRVE